MVNGPVGSKQLKYKCCSRLNISALQPGKLCLFKYEALVQMYKPFIEADLVQSGVVHGYK